MVNQQCIDWMLQGNSNNIILPLFDSQCAWFLAFNASYFSQCFAGMYNLYHTNLKLIEQHKIDNRKKKLDANLIENN